MSICETCENDYDKTFQVTFGKETHTFDSFECAISALAPICSHCKCRILGHGVEDKSNKKIYCCGHCARSEGSNNIAS